MQVLILPYGKAGWSEKTRIMEDMLSPRPGQPLIFSDILVLVPSSRMKRSYGRLFLEIVERVHASAALVPPEVVTLYQFVQRLSTHLGGPSLMDENSRLVLLEGIVKELITGQSAFGSTPDIIAPSLSAAVAAMIEQLASAGITPERLRATVADSDFRDKAQVKMLIDAYDRYEQSLAARNLADPAGLLSVLADRFDPGWLAPYSRIIIDGIHDAGGLQSRLLKKITAPANCTFLVEAPSAESIRSSHADHPLRLIRDFLAAMGFRSFGASTATADRDDLFLSETLFSDKTFEEAARKAPPPASFAKRISLLSAVNTREEVSLIASNVKQSLRGGTVPESILVAFPALDEYGPLVEEIFIDYGIPYNRAIGRQLSTSPVTTAVIALLRACQEDFSGPSLLRIFSSPYLKFAGHPAIAPALDRFMRDRRITGGREKLLAALRRSAPPAGTRYPSRLPPHQKETGAKPDTGETLDLLAEPLADLFTSLEPFSVEETAPLSRWMERLARLVAWSGIGSRVGIIRGPLNTNLQAYKKLNETLASLSRAGKLFPEYRYSFSEWFFLLKKTLMHTRFQVPAEDEGGVQILGLGETNVHAWSEIYLGGLVDGKFPQRLPQNIFLPEATLEALGVQPLERARANAAHHFYRLLLSAPRVTLLHPENEGDRPVVPSAFLVELTPLRKAGLINSGTYSGTDKTGGIQFSLKIEESRSIPELAKAVVNAANFSERRGRPFSAEWLSDLAAMMPERSSELSSIKAAAERRPPPSRPAAIPQNKRTFSVTELDAYLNCPYDYYVTTVLGIEPLEEVTEDISPSDRGSKVHAILKNFYSSWKEPVTRENRGEARMLLAALAGSAFSREADTFRNRREKELFLTVMTERFLDAEEEFWKQGMKPAYLEQRIEHYRLVLANGEEVELAGKIDRIDVDEKGNFVIVDYKTGGYPLPKVNADQDIFQLPVYTAMALSTLRGDGPVLKKPVGLAYYDLSGKTGAGARDVVLFNKEALADQPSSKPRASAKSAEEFEAILQYSVDKARRAVEHILAGNFPSSPQDENKCRYCPNEVMCGEELPER